MMEVELGNLAQQQASSAKVKEFGALMVKDHSKANAELKSIASAKNIMLPSTYPQTIQQHIDEMKKMKGAEFDKHYMSMMVDDHVKDIALFKTATKDNDTSISKFATKTLPVLETHLQKATVSQFFSKISLNVMKTNQLRKPGSGSKRPFQKAHY